MAFPTNPYHTGELAAQRRAGVDLGERAHQPFRPTIPAPASTFLEAQTFAVAATVDEFGQRWGWVLRGRPGFVSVLDERTVRIQRQGYLGPRFVDQVTATGTLG